LIVKRKADDFFREGALGWGGGGGRQSLGFRKKNTYSTSDKGKEWSRGGGATCGGGMGKGGGGEMVGGGKLLVRKTADKPGRVMILVRTVRGYVWFA